MLPNLTKLEPNRNVILNNYNLVARVVAGFSIKLFFSYIVEELVVRRVENPKNQFLNPLQVNFHVYIYVKQGNVF